jgi:hypothetical protein
MSSKAMIGSRIARRSAPPHFTHAPAFGVFMVAPVRFEDDYPPPDENDLATPEK